MWKLLQAGQDAKLYYIDYQGNRKPYLIEGEGGGVKSVNGQTGDVTIDTLDINYQTGTGSTATVTFPDYTYVTYTDPVRKIVLNIQPTKKNSLVSFTTDEEFTVNIRFVDGESKINKPFEFEPNTSYVIAVDNGIVVWTKLETAEV